MIRRNGRSGSATIEMTLIGIPMIFVLISIFEISRGMWVYHTMAYSVKEATRYAIVHGQNCVTDPLNSGCASTATVAAVAQIIQNSGVGLDPNQVTLTFNPPGSTTAGETLTAALANTSQWPPTGLNQRGQPVSIKMIIPFRSTLAMFWPGAGPGVTFAPVFYFPASSTDIIQF